MHWDILHTFGLNQNYFFFILHFPILLPLPTSPSPIRLCLPFVYFSNELFLYLVFVVFPASSSSHKRKAIVFKVNSNLLVFSRMALIYHHLVHHTIGDMSINLQFKVLPFFSVLWQTISWGKKRSQLRVWWETNGGGDEKQQKMKTGILSETSPYYHPSLPVLATKSFFRWDGKQVGDCLKTLPLFM